MLCTLDSSCHFFNDPNRHRTNSLINRNPYGEKYQPSNRKKKPLMSTKWTIKLVNFDRIVSIFGDAEKDGIRTIPKTMDSVGLVMSRRRYRCRFITNYFTKKKTFLLYLNQKIISWIILINNYKRCKVVGKINIYEKKLTYH